MVARGTEVGYDEISDHRGLDPKDIQIIDGMFTAKPTQGTRVGRTDTSRKKKGI